MKKIKKSTPVKIKKVSEKSAPAKIEKYENPIEAVVQSSGIVISVQKSSPTDNIPTPAVSVPAVRSATVAEQIWNEIKDIQISLFSLPSKPVSELCTFALIDPSRCFIIYSVPSFLPALEGAVGPKYKCEIMEKYIVVSREKNV